MKKLALLLPLLSLTAFGQVRTNLLLGWDIPPSAVSTTVTFYVFSSRDITVPMSNWEFYASVPCVAGKSNYTVPVTSTTSSVWFTAGGSNATGFYPFPSAAECPPVFRSDVLLWVR